MTDRTGRILNGQFLALFAALTVTMRGSKRFHSDYWDSCGPRKRVAPGIGRRYDRLQPVPRCQCSGL